MILYFSRTKSKKFNYNEESERGEKFIKIERKNYKIQLLN